jgi:hypothetical protein
LISQRYEVDAHGEHHRDRVVDPAEIVRVCAGSGSAPAERARAREQHRTRMLSFMASPE